MKRQHRGFTLLEILIALLIFTIVALMLMNGLKNILSVHERVKAKANQLNEMQLALLMMERDLLQAINRPVLDVTGKEQPPFVGSAAAFSFTHGGNVELSGTQLVGQLKRTEYRFEDNQLKRMVWPVLDAAPKTHPQSRVLLSEISSVKLQYLNQAKQWKLVWPFKSDDSEPLPKAVKINLIFKNGEVLEQLNIFSPEIKPTIPAPKTST